uniref:Phosphatidylinositol-4,5-bisphosphate 4-phosphatase n=1 Tax=Plectus sambesii TaxID=2011161 RepID=A0A914UIR3_9BILA
RSRRSTVSTAGNETPPPDAPKAVIPSLTIENVDRLLSTDSDDFYGSQASSLCIAYDNMAMVDESKGPTVVYAGLPPPYSGPQPAPQTPYTFPLSNSVGYWSPSLAGPIRTNFDQETTTRRHFACGHCDGKFTFHKANGLARCPFCRQVTSVGISTRTRGIFYIVIGIIALLLGITVVVVMLMSKKHNYLLKFAGIVFGIIFIVRGVLLLLTVKDARPIYETSA